MRRWRVAFLLVLSCLSGCTLALGDDGFGNAPWSIGIVPNWHDSSDADYCEGD